MLENVPGASDVYEGPATLQPPPSEEHKTPPCDRVLEFYYHDSDPLSEKNSSHSVLYSIRGMRAFAGDFGSTTLDLFWPSSFFLPVQKVYRKGEILIFIIALAYTLVHYLMHSFNFELVLGLLCISLQIGVWKKHSRSIHWEFFNIWIKQMKIIILTLASLTILWTDTYWGVSENSWRTLIATIVISSTILFFIQIDLMEMSIFFRVSIPTFILSVAFRQIYDNKFTSEDIPLWTYQGHILTVLDIQNVAWSQIMIFAMLGLWSVVTDIEHKKFYLIEENEQRGPDYTTLGCTLVKSDIALLVTCLWNVCTYYLGAKPVWQIISGLLFMFLGTLFLRGVKMTWSYFLKYRPALLILSAAVIIVCELYRFLLSKGHAAMLDLFLGNTVYIYCVIVAILSDFHTKPTKTFRLLVPLLMAAETSYCVYYDIFVATDYEVITINGHTLGVNTVERNAYCQILFQLIAQLFSLISDHYHTKFFLIPRRCERDEMFERFSVRFESGFNEKLIHNRPQLQGQS